MAKRKSTMSKIRQEYNKQVRRIKNFISRATKRGYRFESNIIPETPKRVTKKQVERLKEIKPITLYKKSTYLTEEGKVVSGVQGRKEERRIAANKGLETKRKRISKQSLKKSPSDSKMPSLKNEPGFDEWIRKKDAEDRRRIEEDEEFRQMFSEGNIIYNQIKKLISDVRASHKKAGEHLDAVLEEQISKYGRDAVMMSIASAPLEVMELVEIALNYNPGDNRHDTAIRELYMLLTGTIPTSKEMRELQESIDYDQSI